MLKSAEPGSSEANRCTDCRVTVTVSVSGDGCVIDDVTPDPVFVDATAKRPITWKITSQPANAAFKFDGQGISFDKPGNPPWATVFTHIGGAAPGEVRFDDNGPNARGKKFKYKISVVDSKGLRGCTIDPTVDNN